MEEQPGFPWVGCLLLLLAALLGFGLAAMMLTVK